MAKTATACATLPLLCGSCSTGPNHSPVRTTNPPAAMPTNARPDRLKRGRATTVSRNNRPMRCSASVGFGNGARFSSFSFGPHFSRSDHPRAEVGDDRRRPLHQLRIGGQDALVEPQVILQTNPHVATCQNCGRDIGHLVAANGKRAPDPVGGHVVDHGEEGVQVVRRAPRHAHAQLHEGRRGRTHPSSSQIQRWPVSNASISIRTPDATIRLAISRSMPGVLTMT